MDFCIIVNSRETYSKIHQLPEFIDFIKKGLGNEFATKLENIEGEMLKPHNKHLYYVVDILSVKDSIYINRDDYTIIQDMITKEYGVISKRGIKIVNNDEDMMLAVEYIFGGDK